MEMMEVVCRVRTIVVHTLNDTSTQKHTFGFLCQILIHIKTCIITNLYWYVTPNSFGDDNNELLIND